MPCETPPHTTFRTSFDLSRMETTKPWAVSDVRAYLSNLDSVVHVLSGKNDSSDASSSWKIEEVGDGNMNFVYHVIGPGGSVCVKRAESFVRVVPEFALSSERVVYEGRYLQFVHRICKKYVPRVIHIDRKSAVVVTEWLEDHEILRSRLSRETPERVGAHVGEFLARVYFYTSDMGATQSERSEIFKGFVNNTEMRNLTADVVFTTPFVPTPAAFPNNYTRPFLDDLVRSLQQDVCLKSRVSVLKARFMTCLECVLHGDLHTGSVMISKNDTKIIDAEFAMLGPIAFDIGLFFAHTLMACISFHAREHTAQRIASREDELLALCVEFWDTFRGTLTALWNARYGVYEDKTEERAPVSASCHAYPSHFFTNNEDRVVAQNDFFDRLFADVCGYGKSRSCDVRSRHRHQRLSLSHARATPRTSRYRNDETSHWGRQRRRIDLDFRSRDACWRRA